MQAGHFLTEGLIERDATVWRGLLEGSLVELGGVESVAESPEILGEAFVVFEAYKSGKVNHDEA